MSTPDTTTIVGAIQLALWHPWRISRLVHLLILVYFHILQSCLFVVVPARLHFIFIFGASRHLRFHNQPASRLRLPPTFFCSSHCLLRKIKLLYWHCGLRAPHHRPCVGLTSHKDATCHRIQTRDPKVQPLEGSLSISRFAATGSPFKLALGCL